MAHFSARRVAASTLLVSLLWISATEGADPPAARPTTLRLIPLGHTSADEPASKKQDDKQLDSKTVDNTDSPREPRAIKSKPRIPHDSPCVLLRNHNVLFGAAVQQGDQVLIRRDDGSEIRLPRTQIACWAQSLRDLYQYRLDHRHDGDIAVHLDDARWCLRFELLDLAAEEIRHVYAIDPDNSQAQLIESRLRHIASAQVTHNKKAAQVQPAAYVQATAKEAVDELHDGIDAIWLQQFAGHVQPTLINRCGKCHDESSERGWRLLLPPLGYRATARMTRENLDAAMPYIDIEFPSESELLRKAKTAHGGGPAPLTARNATALKMMQAWLEAVPAESFRDQSADQNNVGWKPRESHPTHVADVAQVSNKPATEVEPEPRASTADNGAPSRLPQVANPFDPDLFNRRFHPQMR